jgi:hypothetical protein
MKIQKEKYEKGCLMISVKTPDFIKDIQNKLNDKDLYKSDDIEESLETDSHVTIVYGLGELDQFYFLDAHRCTVQHLSRTL